MATIRRIAIIDDDASIRSGLSSLVRSAGFEAHLFTCAEDFLAAEVSDAVDCVLTDVQMPGMSGLALQQTLVRSIPDLPVIVMTAFPEPGMRDRALSAGAAAFLNKPFAADELLGHLDRIELRTQAEKTRSRCAGSGDQ